MDSTKHIGLDVHKEATTIAALDPSGKLVMESIVETKAAAMVQLVQGLHGDLHETFEERDLGGLATRASEALRDQDRGV